MKGFPWVSVWVFTSMIASLSAQNISIFSSVIPSTQTQSLVLPSTHTFQLLAQFGDTLADGSTLKTAPDFTAFVPKNERSDLGLLALNHEIASMQGGVTVFDLALDKINQRWKINSGTPINYAQAGGINRPCSGAITPWGTVIAGEEAIVASDLDSNGYYDSGWLIESNPHTRTFVQKIWKAGNAFHENCVVAPDQKTLYWGADDFSRGFIFKYLAHKKRDLSDGNLFVLVRDDSMSTTATWVQVPNQTPAECNDINTFCQQVGAWNFSGVEDVEIGPYGKIYFASKITGRIWRFKDQGTTVSELSIFVENTEYPIETSNGTVWTKWGFGADNLAFDNAKNLWVFQDGGDNHIWMVKPNHSAFHPKISLFATTPLGSEPTGITFTPNKRYMFLSFQHPYTTNADTLMDVTGKPVVFNRGTTIVIARKEFLGTEIKPSIEIPALASFEVKLTPNPSTDGHTTLRSEAFQSGKAIDVSVFDPSGALCYTAQVVSNAHTVSLDFRAKAKGLYVIRAKMDAKMGVAKLLVE